MSPVWRLLGASSVNELLNLALLLIAGFIIGKLANRFHLPAVTGYLVAGLLIGPSILNLFTDSAVAGHQLISDLALGVIAFTIGREFRWQEIKRVGAGVILITVCEGLTACIVTAVAIRLIGQPIGIALLLGAIATATAPAATVVVMREYRSAGPLTSTLLQVVALDDAVGLMTFALLGPIARADLTGSAASSVLMTILAPLGGIAAAFAIGIALGAGLAFILRHVRNTEEGLALVMGVILLGAGLAQHLQISPLLLNMAVGTTLINVSDRADRFIDALERMSLTIYVPFFVLAGASLHISEVGRLGLIGLTYLLARSAGKVLGAALGSRLAHAQASVQKYLGIALLPQAGVAIGMVLMLQQAVPEAASLITTVVLGSVMVYEMLGPVCAKIAITRAGEVGQAPAQAD